MRKTETDPDSNLARDSNFARGSNLTRAMSKLSFDIRGVIVQMSFSSTSFPGGPQKTKRSLIKIMGPLQLKITWYKIHHAGEQATHCDIQNKENANLS